MRIDEVAQRLHRHPADIDAQIAQLRTSRATLAALAERAGHSTMPTTSTPIAAT